MTDGWRARVARVQEAFAAHRPLWKGADDDLAAIGIEALTDLRGEDPDSVCRSMGEVTRRPLPQEAWAAVAGLVRLADAAAPGPNAIDGPRVQLRPWRTSDLAQVAWLTNTNAEAMRHFPKVMTRAESDVWCARMRAHEEEHGWSFWVAEDRTVRVTVGVVGLLHVTFDAPFTPAVEIGWRIGPAHQRKGYAEEAARLSLDHGFAALGLDRIVAFTAPENVPSWRLMEKLGMRRAGDFEHPRMPEGHRLRHQVWYELRREDWPGLPPGWRRVVRTGRRD